MYKALVNAHPRLKIYRKAETPEHWHYRDHPRIPPIVGVVDEGWQVLRGRRWRSASRGSDRPARRARIRSARRQLDARYFRGSGPAFKSGVVLPPFENIHIYDALAEVLGLTPAPNDGDLAVAQLDAALSGWYSEEKAVPAGRPFEAIQTTRAAYSPPDAACACPR